jgi:hypothetical protein
MLTGVCVVCVYVCGCGVCVVCVCGVFVYKTQGQITL